MKKRFKSVLVFIWNKTIDYKIEVVNKSYILIDKVKKLIYSKPEVLSIDETLDYIIKNKCSVSRFGDGELKLIDNKSILFQESSLALSNKLKEVIKSNNTNHIVCIPDVFDKLDMYEEEPYMHWKLHIAKTRGKWYSVLDKDKKYFNAFISRCYYAYKNKDNCKKWFDKIKCIWSNRDIVIIEGKKSRLGIGNDLFNNAKSISRILCPEKNAFNSYERILEQAKKIDKTKLLLLAIGPTATILAYDLCRLGYQAIDIGHIDIEYEWFLMGATKKEKIENKFIGEAIGGTNVGECDDNNYLGQILVTIR